MTHCSVLLSSPWVTVDRKKFLISFNLLKWAPMDLWAPVPVQGNSLPQKNYNVTVGTGERHELITLIYLRFGTASAENGFGTHLGSLQRTP